MKKNSLKAVLLSLQLAAGYSLVNAQNFIATPIFGHAKETIEESNLYLSELTSEKDSLFFIYKDFPKKFIPLSFEEDYDKSSLKFSFKPFFYWSNYFTKVSNF